MRTPDRIRQHSAPNLGVSRPVILWAVAFACICTASVFYLRSDRVRANQQTQRVTTDLYELGHEQFKSIPMSPIERFRSSADFRSLWDVAPVSGSLPNSDSRSAVIGAVSDFLVARFCADVDAYISFRKQRGARFRTPTEARDVSLDGDYKDMTGSDWPDGMSVEEAFRKIWQAYSSNTHHAGTLVGIARDQQGLAIHFDTMTEFAQHIEPPSSTITAEVWRGATGGCIMSWFVYDRSPAELARNGVDVNYATVAFVAEFSDGSRHPLAMTVLQVPGTSTWRVQHFCAWNSPSNRFVGMPF
jgi:hypothetical protein